MDEITQEAHHYGNFGYGYGYGYPKLPPYPSPIPRPPLSDLDKFLLGQTQIDLQSSPSKHIPQTHEEAKQMRSGFGKFSPFSGSIPGHASGSYQAPSSSSWLLPVMQDQPNRNYFSLDDLHHQGGIFKGEFISFGEETNYQEAMMNVFRDPKAPKRRKLATSTFLIKGQWTEEEDSALTEMVTLFGVRKWAQIAEHLLGRTGKQCRERWQNHLRPDIKKDSWTEEEEVMLVEAHQQFGNRWAEIAKRIPGRTENSIKNHWNATKRRQNSKRKSKKIEGKTKSNVLQEYIKSKGLHETPTASTTTTPELVQTPDSSAFSDDSMQNNMLLDLYDIESSPLLGDPCDEEIRFMQNFFKDCNTNFIVPQPPSYDDQVCFVAPKNQGGFFSSLENPVDLTEEVMEVDHVTNHSASAPLSADLYISHLLEGTGFFGSGPSTPSINQYETENPKICQSSKDMDLMEMVYSSSLYAHGREESFNQELN